MSGKKIAIVGATGMLGQPVTEVLLDAGHTLRLLVRDPEKALSAFGTKVEIRKGDLQDKEAILEFLSGQDLLYLNLSVDPTSAEGDFQAEREGLHYLLEAAKTTGIQRVLYLSSMVHFYQGKPWWVWDIKREAIKRIKSSGLAYTVFYPSTFMESFIKGAYRQGNFITLAGRSLVPMYLIAGEDFGRQVAQSIALDRENAEYYVQGKEGFTADQAARLAARYSKNPKLRVVKMPLEVLSVLGYFSNKMRYGYRMLQALNTYPETFQAQSTWTRLGVPKITFSEYLQKS